MKKHTLILLAGLVAMLAIAGCSSAKANQQENRKAWMLNTQHQQTLQEIEKTAEAVNKEAETERQAVLSALKPEEKAIIEKYEKQILAIQQKAQSNRNGLNVLFSSITNEARLEGVKEGRYSAADVEKFGLYKREDKAWEIADAPPKPSTPAPSPAATPAQK